jgi:ribose/xylose/arabinose/galactoside ABC-type transport system permease subunit
VAGLSRLRKRPSFKRILLSEYLVLYLCVIYFAIFALNLPGFATLANVGVILSNMLPLLAMAVGMTIVLVAGGIDLSIIATVLLSSVLGAKMMSTQGGWLAGNALAVPAAILTMLAVGLVIGAFNGLAVTRLKMPPFIITLTVLLFGSGLAVWVTESNLIPGLPPSFTMIGTGSVLFVPIGLLVVGVLVISAHFLLRNTLYGRWLYAIGTNVRVARISGVPVDRCILGTYLISGVCAVVASILITGRLLSGSPTLIDEVVLLDVIGAAVIGGASIYGGRGKVVWTIFGVILLTLIDNSLLILGLSSFSITICKGTVILLAALLDALRMRLLVAEGS